MGYVSAFLQRIDTDYVSSALAQVGYLPCLEAVILTGTRWIDRDTGRRADVPHFFIYNQKDNNNLQVRAGYLVKRAILK